MNRPDTAQHTTRPRSGLTAKGQAAALLVRVRDRWEQLSPAQQHECAEILGRLAATLRREHSVATRAPSPVRVPLLGRVAS
jgi:hypothetical protein